MPSILHVDALTVSFPGFPPAVNAVSFQLEEGEQLGMLGLSGSGKSMTAKALLGLLPETAEVKGGKAVYVKATGEEVDLLQLDEAGWRQLRGREISLVFQEPLTALNPVHRVGRQLEEAVRHLCPELKDRAARSNYVREWLTRVELPEDQDRILRAYPHELSGGQRQRLLIALALLGKPRLLIADEPTTALDTITEQGILVLLEKLRQDLGMTMIFITHDLRILQQTTSRSLVLRHGKLVHTGTTADILKLPGAGLTASQPAEIPVPVTLVPERMPAAVSRGLTVDDLVINYRGKQSWPWSRATVFPAVRRVSFGVAAGEWVAIVGPSGCGKTTIARCLAGLIPAAEGNVMLPAGGVQLVFQDPFSSLNPRHTVRKILREVLRIQPAARHTVEELLESVGLPPAEFAGRTPGQLSGGQRQRVAIARALAAAPGLLIADEAVSALDVPLRSDILDLLDGLRRSHRLGLLFISHDLELVRERADRIIVLEHGRIVEMGETSKVVNAPQAALTKQLLRSGNQ